MSDSAGGGDRAAGRDKEQESGRAQLAFFGLVVMSAGGRDTPLTERSNAFLVKIIFWFHIFTHSIIPGYKLLVNGWENFSICLRDPR
jgi:hypothetical protein